LPVLSFYALTESAENKEGRKGDDEREEKRRSGEWKWSGRWIARS